MIRKEFNKIMLYGGLALLFPSLAYSKKKLLYTFDDIPYEKERMNGLIDILKGCDCQFYLTGEGIKKYPESVELLIGNGYDVGWHSMNHNVMSRKSKKEFLDDVIKWKSTLKEIVSDYEPIYARFPYGLGRHDQINTLKDEGLKMQRSAIWGMSAHSWDVDSIDWHPRMVRESKMVYNLARRIRSNNEIVLLFHLHLAKPLNFRSGVIEESLLTSNFDKFKNYIDILKKFR